MAQHYLHDNLLYLLPRQLLTLLDLLLPYPYHSDVKSLLTLAITDRAYLLYEGTILQEGTPEELAADEDVRTKYLGSGFVLKRSKSVERARREAEAARAAAAETARAAEVPPVISSEAHAAPVISSEAEGGVEKSSDSISGPLE